MLRVSFVLLAACTELDPYAVFTAGTTGSVYECQATAVDAVELCTVLDQDELEADTGWSCWPTTRIWPRITGCIYGCYPHRGCNARAGCYCPEPH